MVRPEHNFPNANCCQTIKSYLRRKCRILLLGLFVLVYSSVYIRYSINSYQLNSLIPKTLVATTVATFPTTTTTKNLPHWPRLESAEDDRILDQLKYSLPPPPRRRLTPAVGTEKEKSNYSQIYLPHGIHSWYVHQGTAEFSDCPVAHCSLTGDRRHASTAAVVLFRDSIRGGPEHRPPGQIWAYYTLESPRHTEHLGSFAGLVNWTATYRWDSDLVTPYAKYATFESLGESQTDKLRQHIATAIDYLKNKTKPVAWFVSNCNTSNKRLQYGKELAKYIKVDIYGHCGTNVCSRRDPNCALIIKRDYRFYLSFENSNCRDYISEKLYSNAYENLAIPIVMGAPKEDYRRQSPPNSFIHVDDFPSPKELAAYLAHLTDHPASYNAYFAWRQLGTFINTKFWCRLCAMVHAPDRGHQNYIDLETWWRPTGICRNGGVPWEASGGNVSGASGAWSGVIDRRKLVQSSLQLIKRWN